MILCQGQGNISLVVFLFFAPTMERGDIAMDWVQGLEPLDGEQGDIDDLEEGGEEDIGEPVEDGDLALVPHKQHVHLSSGPHGQVLTSDVILRSMVVQKSERGGQWHLIFDEEGFGGLCSPSEDEVIALEELDMTQLYQDDAGMLWMGPDSQGGKPMCLTRKMQEFSSLKLKVRCSMPIGEIEVKVFQLARPRRRSRYMWPIQQFYKHLQLSTFKGEPSKWVWQTIPKWVARLLEYGVEDAFVKSVNSKAAEATRTSTDAFLPDHSFTTHAVLHWLWTFAFCTTKKGGLNAGDSKAHATKLWTALVSAAYSEGCRLTIYINDAHEDHWPLPASAATDLSLQLCVCKDGMVDTGPYIKRMNDEKTAPDSMRTLFQWYGVWRHDVVIGDKVKLLKLLTHGPHECKEFMIALWTQLVSQVAVQLELNVMKSGNMSGCHWPVCQVAVGNDEDQWHARRVDKTCTEHVSACQALCGQHQWDSFGFAMDKVNCRGLDLQNAVGISPGNHALALVPQVVVFEYVVGQVVAWQFG